LLPRGIVLLIESNNQGFIRVGSDIVSPIH
jgi:hypothetical protein